MNRNDVILIMITCLALSGCISSKSFSPAVSCSFSKLPDGSQETAIFTNRNRYSDYDAAYIVLIRRFYPHGHVRWYHALALANVRPYKTTIHLEGTVFRVLKGDKQPGEEFSFVETWSNQGYSPFPDNHPVRLFGVGSWMAPVPAIVALKQMEARTIVTLGRTDSLLAGVLIQCYRASFRAFIEAESKHVGRPVEHFAIVPTDTLPFTLSRISIEDVEAFIQGCIAKGYAPKFSSIWSQGTTWIYATQGVMLPDRQE